MSKKFKVGDKVRVVRDEWMRACKGDVLEVTGADEQLVRFNGAKYGGWDHNRFELVVEEQPKGTFENLIIESLPQGGYTVTSPGRAWGNQPTPLAAFTTVDEALKFAGVNLK